MRKSIAPTTNAKITEATRTKVALDCSSLNFGQVTSLVISCQDSLINFCNLSMIKD